ncbi:hypothetical protein B0H14DRAFT_3444249 [Mycena olivaceomarginata]|nr:hypothetical protein B0H14DRAFT_3444249 [Mycena olivaceomarginata]
MQVRQLLIRAPGAHVPSISRSLPLLNVLSLEDHTLRLVRWRLSEGWAAFLEFRLRPMIYFVHAAVTHDFTLVGAKGVYSLVELDHIKYWVGRVLLHCRLVLSSRCAIRSVYMDNVCIRYPPVIGMPGEATAMFEIMHRVCRSIGYPFDQESWVLNLNLLIPLAESARETRAVLQTELDYPAFDKHGQLLIPDFYSVEAWPQEGTFGIGKDGERVASDGYSVRVLGGKTAGVHASLDPALATQNSRSNQPQHKGRRRSHANVRRRGTVAMRKSTDADNYAPSRDQANVSRGSDDTDIDNATGSEFVPEEKTTSPDSDDEFPSSLSIPANSGEMDVDEESTPPRRARPSAPSSSRGKMSPTKSPSKSARRAKSPSAAAPSRAATPDKTVMVDLSERQLPGWAIPEHIPDFTIRRDPTVPRPDRHTSYQFLSDVEIMESFKDPNLVECRLEDSPPEVFDNPAYLILERGKWLQKLVDGDHSVERYCRVYNGMRVRLLTFLHRFPAPLDPAELPADPNDPFYEYTEPRPKRKAFEARVLKLSEPGNECASFEEYQEATARNTRIRQQHEADEAARFRELVAGYAAELRTWESRAEEYRRQLPIVRARQVETLALYRADRTKILDRIHREGNTVGEYAYHLASRALPLSGHSRTGPSHISGTSSTSAPTAAFRSITVPANVDDVLTPPIAAFADGDSGSGEDRPSEVTRVGPPGKGKMKAAAPSVGWEFREGRAATPSSRVAPGAALSARPEPSNPGPALAGESSRAVSGAPHVGEGPEAGSSQVGDATPYDAEAWHAAHNPFDKHLFQTEVVLNTNGTKAVVSHGWRVDPVNPRFLARLAPYGILGTQVPAIVVGCVECHETQTGCVRIQNAGTPLGQFDFTLTNHVISIVNAELLDMYADGLLAAFSSFTGIDVASRLIARSIIYRQDALLEGRRAPRSDAPAAEEPIERRVDVLLREGRGCESYIEHSLVLFCGAQFGDRQHQLPLPAMQDANDAVTYMTHIVEDLVDRISAGARGMGGSFNQRVTQAFHPERRVRLPENFEVGDRLLDRDGFVAPEAVRAPPPRPPILPADGELSGFPSSYHFGGDAQAQLEERYPGGVAVRHDDGSISGPVAAGGFNASEDTTPRGEASSSGSRRTSARGSLPSIDEETRATTPPSSTAFTSVPSMPSNSSQLSFVTVGSAGSFGAPRFAAASFDTTPTPLRGGPALVGSSVGRLSALDMTPLTPSMARGVATRGISLPPRIVVDTRITRTSSPGCAASVDAGNAGYFRGLETGDAG